MWLPENIKLQMWLAFAVHLIFVLDRTDQSDCSNADPRTLLYVDQVNGVWFCWFRDFLILKRCPGNSAADGILSLSHGILTWS